YRRDASAPAVGVFDRSRESRCAFAVTRPRGPSERICKRSRTKSRPTDRRSGMSRNWSSVLLVLSIALENCASCGSNTNPGATQDSAAAQPAVDVAKVTSKKLAITVRLPGELQAYESVAVFPKVTAYVNSIDVDRGSRVKTGQLMARLVAPEVAAQRAEA